jgi:hypothetical protein
MHPIQIEIFKKMPSEEKFHLMTRLYNDAKEIKKASLRSLHPDWSEKEIEKAVLDLFIYGTYSII